MRALSAVAGGQSGRVAPVGRGTMPGAGRSDNSPAVPAEGVCASRACWPTIGRVKLVLLDLDGTLLLTAGAGRRAMQRAGVLVCGAGFTLDGTVIAGGLDPLIYAEAAGRAGVKDIQALHETFRATYVRELQQELAANLDQIEVMPGIRSVIERLRCHSDVTLGLLTGNYSTAAPLKLRAAGLAPEWFVVNAFGDEAPDRPALVALARQRFHARYGRQVQARDVIVVGDTPRDVHCAKVNGCLSFGVATGRYSVRDLQEAGADVVVQDLSDPQPLWNMIDG